MDTSTIPYVITKDYSILYPVYTIFVQSLNVISLAVLLHGFIKGKTLYRRQSATLFLALFIIAMFNVAFITKIFGQLRFDLSPALFGVASIVIFYGMFKHKLLDAIPVSRNVLVDTMDSGLLVLDNNDKIIDVNHTFEKIFEVSVKDILGERISDINILKEYFADKVMKQYEIACKDYRLIVRSNVLKKGMHSAGIMYIINDITNQHRDRQEMLKQQATISIMDERERLGRDLHDSFGQIFAYMNTQAQAVKEYMSQNNIKKAEDKLDELINVAKHSHDDIRAFILQMQGSKIKNRNFRVALTQYANDLEQRFGMNIDIDYDEDLPAGFPDDDKAIQIIKIIGEAMNNIRNHAGECTASIQFKKVIDTTQVIIQDNGNGFDMNIIESGSGYGLAIMQERAKEARSELFIESKLGKGTVVKLVFLKGV